MISLLQTHSITFSRPSSGYYVDGEWVDGAITTIPSTGSLQPYKQGKVSLIPPEGLRTTDLRLYYTKTLLRTADEFQDITADYCVIGGRQFQVFDFEDWSGYGLETDHYKYLLVAADQRTTGGE